MRRKRALARIIASVLGGALVLLILLVARTSDAGMRSRSRREPIRLHGRLELLSFSHYNPEGPGLLTNTVGLGVGRTTLRDSGLNPYGVISGVRPVWSVGLGVLLQDRINVGAKFAVAADVASIIDENDQSNRDRATIVGGNVVPYFRWVFLPGARFRPFVEAHAGLGGGVVLYKEGSTDARRGRHSLWPEVGIAGGLHAFVNRGFSFDLGFGVDYWAPYSRARVQSSDTRVDEDFLKQGDLVNVGLTLGLSVWFW